MTKLKQLYDRYNKDPAFDYLRGDDINFVPGRGILKPTAMLIGEAPGEIENAQAIPFVGRAGIQLNKLLMKAEIDTSRLFFTNVLKFRPMTEDRKNRPPTNEEINLARPYIMEEIEIVQPIFVGLCGRIPTKTILPNIDSVRSINGRLIQGMYLPLYHPAVVLYKREKYEEVLSGYRTLANLIASLEQRVND